MHPQAVGQFDGIIVCLRCEARLRGRKGRQDSSLCPLVEFFRGLGLQRPHQPGNDDLLEDDRIGPDLRLPPKVAALRIDPGSFWDVAFAEEQINVGDRNLRVEHSGRDEHGSHRFSQ